MSLVTLAYGDSSGGGDGPLVVNNNWLQLAELAFNLSIGQVSASELEQFVNPAAVQAEAGQPEGAQIEFDISGWTIFGTDYSPQVAAQINQYWQQGQFTVNGENMQAWPGANQVAYGGNDTVTLQYIKGQIWILWVALAIAVAVWAYNLLQGLTGGQKWAIGVNSATVPKGGIPGWWNNLPLWEKIGIFAIGGLTIGGIIIIVVQMDIAKAGASHSEVYVER